MPSGKRTCGGGFIFLAAAFSGLPILVPIRNGARALIGMPASCETIEMGSSPSFILSSFLDYARAIARRTERQVIAFKEKDSNAVSLQILSYLNRLSSTLFILARYAQKKHNIPEEHPKYE